MISKEVFRNRWFQIRTILADINFRIISTNRNYILTSTPILSGEISFYVYHVFEWHYK